MGIVFVFVVLAHVFIETPFQQYDVWATGVSHLPQHLGQPNLLHIASLTLGVLAVLLSMSLMLLLLITAMSFWMDGRSRAAR